MTPTAARSALLLSALAGGLVLACPAAAEPSAVGTYTFTAEDGESATWNLTPCVGNTPGCVRVSETGNSKRAPWSGEAHYSVGSWILFVQQSDAILCDDGTSAPGQNTYSWDNATLSGNVSIFNAGACGAEPGSLSIPFRLAKTGSVPAPVDAAPPAPAAPAAPDAAEAAPAAPAGPVAETAPPPPPPAPLAAESPVGS